MRTFTVVLHRPEAVSVMCIADHATDFYVAQVKAKDESDAVDRARTEVWRTDKKDLMTAGYRTEFKNVFPIDYVLVVVFEGKHDAKLYGWQL